MNSFSIKDLENLSGIKAHTLRIWEQRYALIKPRRTETNIRYYDNEELKKILNIALLLKQGYKISHINKLAEQEINEKIISLFDKQSQQNRAINDLIQAVVETEIEKFELILNKQIKLFGIEKTITQIIFPFLQKIGILWLTNNINPAQEHLISNLIRQKLLASIDNIPEPKDPPKSFLLFLPEGEFHELGILFVNYLLKVKGIKTYYLGANIPVSDLSFIIKIKKPDFLFTHLTAVAKDFNLANLLSRYKKYLPDTPVVFSGFPIQSYTKKISHPFYFKKSLNEVVEFISTIK